MSAGTTDDRDDPRNRPADLGLVVPLYNEQSRFDEFGQQLVDFLNPRGPGCELVFVDDGSDDATTDLVEELIAKNLFRSPIYENYGNIALSGHFEPPALVALRFQMRLSWNRLTRPADADEASAG